MPPVQAFSLLQARRFYMTQRIGDHSYPATHSGFIGRQAVVIGAGIAGLAAAGALADWFERVLVLERDSPADALVPRPGTPQAGHTHGLLVGGQCALEDLFPGIGEDLVRAGAVRMRINQDLREEFPDRAPMPQRDFGRIGYTMTRPLIETVLRRRVSQRANVTLHHDTRALSIVATANGQRVAAVRCVSAARTLTTDADCSETVPADFVVEASGRGHLTSALLRSIGRPLPEETTIGVDIGYTTAVMDIPHDAPPDWKLVLTHPNAPHSTRRAVMIPVEGNRWMLSVAGRGNERPPGEWSELLAYLRQLSTRTIYDAVRHARPTARLARFGFRESAWRHFERLEAFPDGLIPIGDAICRFNPIYGQGMTVAAKEASLLHRLLGACTSERDPLRGLGQLFLAEAKSLIETPWTMASIPDFAVPATRGERPADIEHSLRFGRALSRVAARDEAVQRLVVEVWHMLKPITAYQDPALVRLVEAEMMESTVG
jgi:2-polyprenyl-6-methoxyphenol hydroxylase-like FAD-dependent oxidoreductase